MNSMKKHFGWTGIITLILFPVYLFSQDAEKNENQPGNQYPAYEVFESIIYKNIFNPNRRPQRQDDIPEESTPDPDEHVLTGTMVTEKENFAFFEDARSGDIAVVSSGNTFLGFEVGNIENTKVILKKTDTAIEIPVLMALQKEMDKDWEIVSPSGRRASSSAGSNRRGSSRRDDREPEQSGSSTPSSQPASEDSSGSGDVQNEVLKRLLEKRRQETGQ